MIKIELAGMKEHTLVELLKYSSAAQITVDQLICEIVEDAMLGNDIKGSLEDTLGNSEDFTGRKRRVICLGNAPQFSTFQVESCSDDKGGTFEVAIEDPKHDDHTRKAVDYFNQQKQFRTPWRVGQNDHAKDLNQTTPLSNSKPPEIKKDVYVNPYPIPQKPSTQTAALLTPKPVDTEPGAPVSFDKMNALAATFGKPLKVDKIVPAAKAEELLSPEASQLAEAQNAITKQELTDAMYLSWLDDAINNIKALPQGQKFVANQFLPAQASPEEARVFGKKLLQLITKYKLFSSKRKGKACMEYIKS